MNISELKQEAQRLRDVIEEAKTARPKLAKIEAVMALYGDNGDRPAKVKGPCVFPSCGNGQAVRGLCHTHYSRWRAPGPQTTAEELAILKKVVLPPDRAPKVKKATPAKKAVKK